MRFLIDENVKVKVLRWLIQHGHDATRVPTGTRNGNIVALGITESRTLITHDHDFADRLRYPPTKHAGVILLEIHPPILDKLIVALDRLLSSPPSDSFIGQLIVLQEQGFRLIS